MPVLAEAAGQLGRTHPTNATERWRHLAVPPGLGKPCSPELHAVNIRLHRGRLQAAMSCRSNHSVLKALAGVAEELEGWRGQPAGTGRVVVRRQYSRSTVEGAHPCPFHGVIPNPASYGIAPCRLLAPTCPAYALVTAPSVRAGTGSPRPAAFGTAKASSQARKAGSISSAGTMNVRCCSWPP